MVASSRPDPSFTTLTDEQKQALTISLVATLKAALPDDADVILALVDVEGKDSFLSSSMSPRTTAVVLLSNIADIHRLYAEKDDPDHD